MTIRLGCSYRWKEEGDVGAKRDGEMSVEEKKSNEGRIS